MIILAVSPLTHFDADESLDLLSAVRKLRGRRRDLIVCGLTRPQFKVLNAAGVTGVLGLDNFCPDLDLAIARAMNRLYELNPSARKFREVAENPRAVRCRTWRARVGETASGDGAGLADPVENAHLSCSCPRA